MSEKTPTNGSEIGEISRSNFKELLREWIFFQMKFVRKEGLAIPQLFTLRYIYYNRPENLTSIAEFMGVSKPTVTGIIGTLEKDGFLKREMNPNDRRRVDIVLTEKSVDLFKRFESLTTFVIEDFVQSLPEEDLVKINDTMEGLAKKLRETSNKEFSRGR